MRLCQCHPCQMHRIAMIGVDDVDRERIAAHACEIGVDPEPMLRRAIHSWLSAMDEARTIMQPARSLPGNVVSLHRRMRT